LVDQGFANAAKERSCSRQANIHVRIFPATEPRIEASRALVKFRTTGLGTGGARTDISVDRATKKHKLNHLLRTSGLILRTNRWLVLQDPVWPSLQTRTTTNNLSTRAKTAQLRLPNLRYLPINAVSDTDIIIIEEDNEVAPRLIQQRISSGPNPAIRFSFYRPERWNHPLPIGDKFR